MPIDASIPLQVKLFDAAKAMRDAEDLRAARQNREYEQLKMDKVRSDIDRDNSSRAALSDWLISQGDGGAQQGAPQPGAVGPPDRGIAPSIGAMVQGQGNFGDAQRHADAPQNPRLSQVADQMGQPSPGQQGQPSAYERAVRADPDAFLSFEGKRLGITSKHLEAYRDLNDTAMQLLGGVYDQPSYDAAKARAHQLYARHGMSLEEMNLPDQYSPELVKSLQMQGMDTSKQLQAVARENRLNWDQYDDQQDNDRADTLAGSTVQDRDSRREYTRQRIQIARERANGGGGNSSKPAGPPKSENALFTDIQRRFNAGEDVTDRERQFAHDYQRRHGGREPQPRAAGKGRAGSSTNEGAVIVNPSTGQRMRLQGGRWVPVQ